MQLTRRHFLGTTTAGCLWGHAVPGSAAPQPQPLSLGFSLYGMQTLKTEDGLRALVEIGYDSVELCLMPEWDATPARLTPARRREVRQALNGSGLALTALMEHVDLTSSAQDQRAVHERLKVAAELGHQLKPQRPPLIETVTGHGKFAELRNRLRDNLGEWAKVAQAAQTVVAIKPHRGGVIDRPEQGVWLVEQVNSPWIRLNYDYSHFAHRDIDLQKSIQVMIPHTCFIHVKDTVIRDGRARFVLPGESDQIDYAQLLRWVHQHGYRGDICCEVSAWFSQKGYDPIQAAKTCYRNLAAAFQRSGIPRVDR